MGMGVDIATLARRHMHIHTLTMRAPAFHTELEGRVLGRSSAKTTMRGIWQTAVCDVVSRTVTIICPQSRSVSKIGGVEGRMMKKAMLLMVLRAGAGANMAGYDG